MTSRTRGPLDIQESPGLAQARRLAKAKGPPPTDYPPPVRVLPGKRVKVLLGQLDLYGNERGRHE